MCRTDAKQRKEVYQMKFNINYLLCNIFHYNPTIYTKYKFYFKVEFKCCNQELKIYERFGDNLCRIYSAISIKNAFAIPGKKNLALCLIRQILKAKYLRAKIICCSLQFGKSVDP